MLFKGWRLKISDKNKRLVSELKKANAEKDSHIRTLEAMLESNEKRHVNDMKIINNKLDLLSNAYKKQTEELAGITKELLWQREEAIIWRRRLEEKMAMDEEEKGISPPKLLRDIERRIKSSDEKSESDEK